MNEMVTFKNYERTFSNKQDDKADGVSIDKWCTKK